MKLSLIFIEIGTEAYEDLEFSDDEEIEIKSYKPEVAIISAPTILLTLEAGIGNKTLPMLLLYLGFQSNISDWSTNTVIYFFFLLSKLN
jgi:vacuolar protein sorting-associated protein 13A/C